MHTEEACEFYTVEAGDGKIPQFMHILSAEAAHLMILRVSPASLYRICIRRIGREVEGLQSRMASEKLFHDLGRLNSRSFPDQFDQARNFLAQVPKKLDPKASIEVGVRGEHLKDNPSRFALGEMRDCSFAEITSYSPVSGVLSQPLASVMVEGILENHPFHFDNLFTHRTRVRV